MAEWHDVKPFFCSLSDTGYANQDDVGEECEYRMSNMSVHFVDVEEGKLPSTFSYVTKDGEKSNDKNKVKVSQILLP